MNKKLILFESPGHSWLRVSLKDLDDLGIRDQGSGFSYQDDEFAYLDEEIDMPVYLEAVNLVSSDIDRFDPRKVLYGGLLRGRLDLN